MTFARRGHARRAARPFPVVRALVSGTGCTLGTLVAHQLAGGTSLPAVGVIIWPLAVLLCGWPADGRARLGELVAVALGSQLGWHLLLATTAAGHGPAHLSGTASHAMGQGQTGSGQMGPEQMATAAPTVSHSPADWSLGMFLAHLGVAAVTVVLCHGGERALLELVVRRLLPALPRARLLIVLRRRRRPVRRPRLRIHDRGHRGPAPLRGPPLLLR